MPELPEVETVARQLKKEICGDKITKIEVIDEKLKHMSSAPCIGMSVVECHRIAKNIVLSLSSKNKSLYISTHLRMTGRLLWQDKKTPILPHTRVILHCKKGKISFVDTRRFGTMLYENELNSFSHLGVEPLSSKCNLNLMLEMLKNCRQEIKPWLMKQDKIVGIGNIYASEILFAAKVDPQKRCLDLEKEEVRQITKQMKRILKKAIENCGTTFSDFQDAHGVTGSYQNFLKVYNQTDKPCPRCKTSQILRIVQQQRSTFFCKDCQL